MGRRVSDFIRSLYKQIVSISLIKTKETEIEVMNLPRKMFMEKSKNCAVNIINNK